MALAQDTIYALSSGSLPSGVAIVRVSGSKAKEVIEALHTTLPAVRYASLRVVRDRDGLALDQALLLYFPAPHSFTGEDVLEFHLHGGRAVVQAVIATIATVDGVRAAEAGEFTRRAFDNGKLDLVEVEGLSDLLAAETEMQRRLAMDQARGGQSLLYQRWMTELTHCRAMIEAELDFPEEDDIPGSVSAQSWAAVNKIASEIILHLNGQRAAEIVRDGYHVVIAGRPNSGKSSLLNNLAKRDVAIVTDQAGTTRDVLTVDLNLNGYLVRLTDTAGLRDAADMIEAEGIRRARFAAQSADLILHLREFADSQRHEAIDSDAEQIYVATKCDRKVPGVDADVSISVHSNWGIDDLLKLIQHKLEFGLGPAGANLLPARERHVFLLRETLDLIVSADKNHDAPLEIRSESLRLAAQTLGKITGFVDADDLLGVIFGEFCIGK